MAIRCNAFDCKFNKGGWCENDYIEVDNRVCTEYESENVDVNLDEKEKKELIEKLDRLSITVWKILLDKPVYDLDTKELPNQILDALTKANTPTKDKELAVVVAEELIKKKEEINVKDVQALQDILLMAKIRLEGDRKRRFKIIFRGSVVVDAWSENEAIMKFMRKTMEDVKPEVEEISVVKEKKDGG